MSRTVIFLAVSLVLTGTRMAYSQEVRASVTGLVTDPTGAAVAGAKVTVTHIARNVAVTTESNATGNYVTPFLAPGNYQMTVEAAGFKRFVRENIVLQAMDAARIDVPLQLGALTESITVSEAVSVLETESASRSQLIPNQMVMDVPTQGRNIFQLAWSAAGVIKNGNWQYLRYWDIGGMTGFSINGGRVSNNEVLLDGVSNVQGSRTIIHAPPPETVQEFKALTNTYDAQYGRTGGGIISIVTKGGANQFHGSAFEDFQNYHLNANTFELNAASLPKGVVHLNTFGVNANGPVYIPKVFDGRNRLFFLINREYVRQRTADPGVYTFPLMTWRGGDFSTLYNASNQPVLIYDPLTVDKATNRRQPIAGNKIPTNRLSPIAVNALKYYPAPLSDGTGPAHINNYTFPSRWIAGCDAWIGRIDYSINPKNNVYFRYGENPYWEYRSLVFVSDISILNPAEPSGNSPLKRNGRTWMFDWTSTLSPRMTFDLRVGLNRWESGGGSFMGGNYDPKQLGFDAALVNQFTVFQFPNFSLGQYQGMGSSVLNWGANDTYSFQPNMNFVVGRHFLKWGFDARQYKDYTENPGSASGAYTFTKGWTQANVFTADTTSGNELASFLLGYPASGYVDKNIAPAFAHRYFALFFHDDFKVSNRMTLNLGLRWDYETPNHERFNRVVRGLDFNAASPIASQVKGFDAKGAVLFAGVNGQPSGAFNSDRNNFQPRVGVAYRISPKWVLRGGYGLYYLGQNENGSTNGFSQRTNVIATVDSYTPAVTMTNPFTNYPSGQLLSPTGAAQGAASFLGQSVQANWFNRPLPYSHQYSFDIQRELPGSFLVEVGYVGNQTKKLPINFAVNYVPIDQLGRRNAAGAIDTAYYTAQVPNPFAGLIPNNAALNGATIQRQVLMYPYPQYSGVTAYQAPVGGARYDGFQTKFSKRYSRGLTLVGSYSIMKNLERVNVLSAQYWSLSDPLNPKLEKRSAGGIDIPQKFVVSGVYELPFGKGRPYVNNYKALDYIVGGWQLNWDITYQRGWVFDYPTAAQVTPGSAKLSDPTEKRWFNTSLWQGAKALEPYTLRNYPTLFSDVRGNGYQNWDASVSKYFPIRESVRLQFRGELINALNHPWRPSASSPGGGGGGATAGNGLDFTNPSFGMLQVVQSNLPRWFKLCLYLHW